MTMKDMHIGLTSLKRNCEFDPMTPFGVHADGEVERGSNRFSAAGRDFRAARIAPGARLYILEALLYVRSDEDARGRIVAAVDGDTLTLKGRKFTADGKKLEYFIVRADGSNWPEIDLAKELHPTNPAWAEDYVPHLNKRKRLYYPCKEKRIKDGRYVDPWGTPYVYVLRREGDLIVEKIVSAGRDEKWGTKDDLEEIMTEIPLPGPAVKPKGAK